VRDATLVLPLRLHAELEAAASASAEVGFVLLVSVAEQTGAVRLLGRELHPVPDRGYLSRDIDGMTVTPTGYLAALARAKYSVLRRCGFTPPGSRVITTAERQGRTSRPPARRYLPDPHGPALVRSRGVRDGPGDPLDLQRSCAARRR